MPIEYIPHPITAIINDVTGARAFGVFYANNTLRPMQVIISCTHLVNLVNNPLLVQLNVAGVAISLGGYFNTTVLLTELYSMVIGNVPPGGGYQLAQNAAGGINTIIRWIEVNQ